jgi:hypothetical protein
VWTTSNGVSHRNMSNDQFVRNVLDFGVLADNQYEQR